MRMGKLEISLLGPFVTMLRNFSVEIYAPRCIGHYASIFTTEDEASLEADRDNGMDNVFEIYKSGIKVPESGIARVNGSLQLHPPDGSTLSKDKRRAWFCLKLPKPTHVVGIKPDQMTIKGTGVPAGDKWATALRLIFDYDMDQPEFELIQGGTSVLKTRLKDYSAPSEDKSSRFDITIRNVGPFVLDPNHDDARACFEASARLFQWKNVDLDWQLDKIGPAIDGRPGGDCASAQLLYG